LEADWNSDGAYKEGMVGWCHRMWNTSRCPRKMHRSRKSGLEVIWHKAASLPHTDGSLVFIRWRQCAPHLMHASFGPPASTSKVASRSVQLFLHRSLHGVPILYDGSPLFHVRIATLHGDLDLHLIRDSLGRPDSTP